VTYGTRDRNYHDAPLTGWIAVVPCIKKPAWPLRLVSGGQPGKDPLPCCTQLITIVTKAARYDW